MKWRFFVLTFFLLNIGGLNALNTQLSVIPRGHILSARFIQKRHIKDLNNPIQSKGMMYLWVGRGLIWETQDPLKQSVLINQNGFYLLNNHEKTTLLETGGENIIFDLININDPQKVQGFKIEELAHPPKGFHFRFIPQSKRALEAIQSIEIQGKIYIERMVIHRPSGNWDEMLFEGHEISKEAPPYLKVLFND